MTRIARIFVVAWLALALAGCATLGRDETADWSAERFYEEGRSAMDAGDYEKAAGLFERLEARFPHGPYAQQAQLELPYAYYRGREPASAIAAADRFIQLHPRHEHVDYAYYIRGLASFQHAETRMERLFRQDAAERDPQAARESFAYFRELVQRFPDSRYAEDATERMIHLRNMLARYELHVANYYFRRGAMLAAANRAKYVVENYDQTPSVPDALAMMAQAYGELGQDDLADDAREVLRLNFPDHPAAQAPRAQRGN
ncbi:outer membrane protein assembly factor BamD [Ectothiorhodospiraceae bacterium 2226]|nr:outer membrane protein assembly factor BamD [Ectothiorhodospiraceae bacterium 2226]